MMVDRVYYTAASFMRVMTVVETVAWGMKYGEIRQVVEQVRAGFIITGSPDADG